MANAPSIGGGVGGVGALPLAKKKDGTDAIFANTTARDTYYRSNPDMLAKLESGNKGIGIGTADNITAAYMRKDRNWIAIATNFKGSDGKPGKPGAGVDLSGFKDREIPVVDHQTNALVESGVFAHDGEVETEPDSVIIGSHEISSSAENVVVTNLVDEKHYAPVWQEVTPGADSAHIRSHGVVKRAIRFSSQSRQITNPVFKATPSDDETVFSVEVNLARPVTNITLEAFIADKKLFRSQWGSKPSGDNILTLKTPADFKKGVEYTVKITSEDGDIVLMGGTDGNPKYAINYVAWVDKKIATEEFVLANSGGGTKPIPALTAEDISKAIDHGEYTGSGSLKSLDYGWWVIKASNTAITGRPGGSKGDLIVFKNSIKGASAASGFSIMLAFGKDSGDKHSIWAEYRDGIQWTPWFKVNSDVDLSNLNRAVAVLQTRMAVMTTDVSTLKTEVGNIYAPNKIVFDREVNALIDAKIKDKPPVGVLPRIYALFSNTIPDSLSIEGMVTSTTGEARITKENAANRRACVLVENDNGEADRVTGFSVDGGVASSWVPRDTTIGGKKYRAFFSSGAYRERAVTIKVNFS